jgi:L-iditol 2-dehydrogenase
MKAAFLTGVRQVEIRDAPEAVLQKPTDVLLRVETVGVCGSDMHYYRSGRIGVQIVEYPWIIGHEFAGTVLEVGPEVQHLRVGQRVAVDPLIHCGRCDQCRLGNIHTCRDQAFLGCPGQAPGSLAERIVMPAASCFPIPESMTSIQATLVEPFSIALWTRHLGGAPEAAKVTILGSGPIGLCVLAASKAAGACTVYQTDLLDNRLRMARRLGADWTGNAGKADAAGGIAAAEPLGLDVVFECAGVQETLDQAVELVRPRGKVVVVGIPEGDRVSFDMNQMRRKELRIQNVRRQLHRVEPAIEMIARAQVNLDALVTHEFTFAETKAAFDLAADYRDNIVKAMIHVNPGS